MDWHSKRAVRVTCPRLLGDCLASELTDLEFSLDQHTPRFCELKASLADCERLNLSLRTAMNVLVVLSEFECDSPDMLYTRAREIAWEDVFDADEYVSITARVEHPTIDNSGFAALRIKDAIVDHMMATCAARPTTGPDRDNVVLHLEWIENRATIYVNTSGHKLSERGYRRLTHKAPLQESLAAALLLIAGYDGSQALTLPMCGTGTLAIEAALIARHRAPGLLRDQFGFQHLVGFDPVEWRKLRARLRNRPEPKDVGPIIATDIDPVAIDAAMRHARTAGVDQAIAFSVCDIADTPVPSEPGIVLMNPPYGHRMGSQRDLEALYGRIGDFLKQRCAGSRGFVFTGDFALGKRIGLRPKRRHVLFNANIDCRLLEFELYDGTRRTFDDKSA